MQILANMRSKICIKGGLIISSKVVTIWLVTRGEGGGGSRQCWQSVTRGREGSQICGRPVTYFLDGPLELFWKKGQQNKENTFFRHLIPYDPELKIFQKKQLPQMMRPLLSCQKFGSRVVLEKGQKHQAAEGRADVQRSINRTNL